MGSKVAHGGDERGRRSDRAGDDGGREAWEDVVGLGDEYGWPIAIKAAGGRRRQGMKVVESAGDAGRAYQTARREGEAYFADPAVYVEKYVDDPATSRYRSSPTRTARTSPRRARLHDPAPAPEADRGGPSPAVTPELRARMGAGAVDAARAVGYVGAGTVECLLDSGATSTSSR